MKTMQDVRKRLIEGEATVWTAMEMKERVRKGDIPTEDEVDVVTTGTFGIMSGTTAVLTVPVAEPGAFLRADAVTLNGVPTFPGPCPNERLGTVDLIVYGTAAASETYGGGHLFRDIVDGREVEVMAQAGEMTFETEIYIEDLSGARIVTTRSCFRNYTAFVNRGPDPVRTIFSVFPFEGNMSAATVSGCGEVNPVENDPSLTHMRPGTPLLLNGASGIVIGEGTRSTPEHRCIAASAELSAMDPEYLGGFVTAHGPECLTSIAVALPVLTAGDIACLSVTDDQIPLPVADISDRLPFSAATYADVWQGTDRMVQVDPLRCLFCGTCSAAEACPTRAIMMGGGIMHSRCVSCGTCVQSCVNGVYTMATGALHLKDDSGATAPVVLRQSDRSRAEALCDYLKDQLIRGEFQI
ncbi:methanogenesis marker 16 metalloprotein [Methanogenium organophilum]|uniref:Methanogenesis marker 16 metalloprotein n=1 Tax=Methanogenium organophilum TaxID=2199 RepID=A0A9X9T9H9_METOG|nr:methanogenesis marker 16 metalloprotein [Methanogenium organophilum]WAI02426.1 methanogenesis marker 16 metalloprotein [Methanogenium organophilum]